MSEKKNEFKGYTLFNDLEDKTLRNRNRAVVMANIVEFNTKKLKITPKGASLVYGYFKVIPEEDRIEVYENFNQQVKERGYTATKP